MAITAAFVARPVFAQNTGAIADYANPGTYIVTDRDEVWHDAIRSREVPVRFHVPGGGPIRGTILFSHGLGGSLVAGAAWMHQGRPAVSCASMFSMPAAIHRYILGKPAKASRLRN
jgi:hypothetical protein